MVLTKNKEMANSNIDDFIAKLRDLRLARAQSLTEVEGIQSRLNKGNRREERILNRIQTTARAAGRQGPARNRLRVGDIVRITNTLRDEYSTIGTVTRVGPRFVTIQGKNDRRTYTRGWWNLELVPPNTNINNAQKKERHGGYGR